MLPNRQNHGISDCLQNVAYDDVSHFHKDIKKVTTVGQYNLL